MNDASQQTGPSALAGRYELAEPLGSGGMSRVVAAHDPVLGRRVAVKLLRDDLAADPVVRERLLREARAAASFTHPNAVSVYDVGEADGRPFIVMELVDGRPLTEILRERGSLPVEEAVHIADGVLAALAAAHSRGLVHRDVKPGNILIDAHGHVKLADFGIAKGIAEATAGLTATGQVVGTPRYLAPEQAAGGAPDARSDLYAAGIVCYEMLAGAPPFSAQHAVAIALAHQREPVPPLVDGRPDVPPGIAAAVHRALAKRPADRFESATQMREALGDALAAGHTTAVLPAAPADGGAQGRRWLWPSVALAGLTVLALVVLVAALDGGGSPDDGEQPAAADEAESDGEEAGSAGDAAAVTPTPTPPPGERLGTLVTELRSALADDNERFGEKSDDLLEDLDDVLGEGDRAKQAREARKLMNEIEKWVDDAELDRDVGMRALVALEDFVRAEREADWGAP